MSMYNMVMGTSPLAPVVTATLGIHPNGSLNVGRIRDAHLIKVGDELRFEVLTRNGENSWSDNAEEVNAEVRKHPLFIRDYDDSLDTTYKTFEFKIPEDQLEDAKLVWEKMPEEWRHSCMKRFRNVIDSLVPEKQSTGETFIPSEDKKT